MQCLIDGDVLRYEIGFAAETSWKHLCYPTHDKVDNPLTDEQKQFLKDNPPPWELVVELLDNRVSHIEVVCESTDPSVLFFTGKTNFRNEIAKRAQYKERAGTKPYHFYNIEAYLKSKYQWEEVDGLEADDLMAIYQSARGYDGTTIICTRDKDLRQVPGLHYGWELGEQPSFGPFRVEGYGSLDLDSKQKLRGYGTKYFLAQCIMGDPVDSIPGLKRGAGPKAALKVVGHTQTYAEGLQAVREAYREVYGDSGDAELLEQGQLLWMTRELWPESTNPILWSLEYEE